MPNYTIDSQNPWSNGSWWQTPENIVQYMRESNFCCKHFVNLCYTFAMDWMYDLFSYEGNMFLSNYNGFHYSI